MMQTLSVKGDLSYAFIFIFEKDQTMKYVMDKEYVELLEELLAIVGHCCRGYHNCGDHIGGIIRNVKFGNKQDVRDAIKAAQDLYDNGI